MIKRAASKVMWVGRATVFLVGVAVILALVLGVATTAMGAKTPAASYFQLGQSNSSNAISSLVGAVGGPNLKVQNTSPDSTATALELQVPQGKAPMKVNTDAGTATNLSADKLDGLDSSNFAAYKRTVVVGPVGTPTENGTALKNALSGIADASESNPYLLKIEPGIYDVGSSDTPLNMKPYVDVEGSGEGVTTITATGSNTSKTATVVGAANSELRSLTVKNTGGLYYATTIYNNASTFRLTSMTGAASGGTFSWGLHADDPSTTILNQTTLTASHSPTSTRGITGGYNSDIQVRNSQISTDDTTQSGAAISTLGVAHVGTSQLAGGTVFDPFQQVSCAGVYDENFAFSANTCP